MARELTAATAVVLLEDRPEERRLEQAIRFISELESHLRRCGIDPSQTDLAESDLQDHRRRPDRPDL